MAEKRPVSRAESVGVESSDDKSQLLSALGVFMIISSLRLNAVFNYLIIILLLIYYEKDLDIYVIVDMRSCFHYEIL